MLRTTCPHENRRMRLSDPIHLHRARVHERIVRKPVGREWPYDIDGTGDERSIRLSARYTGMAIKY